jgi:two-component sensor histidine kinase/PAS domain-containing protein
MASICFTIAINEFLTWSRRSNKNSDIAFTLICLGGTFFCLFCSGEYDVDSPVQSIPWLKAQVISISFTAFAFFWFFAEETRLIDKRYVIGYLIWTILVSSSQVLDLGDLTWIASRPFVLRVGLPFGLSFVYKEVYRGIILVVADFVGFVLLVYLVRIVAKFRRLGNHGESFCLFGVLGVVIAAEVNDFLVGIRVYSFIFLMEYAWLTAILIVGLRRSNEIMDAILTKQALRKSDRELTESQTMLTAIIDSTSDMIWSVDSASFGLLAFNQGLRDYFLRKHGIGIAVGMRPEDIYPLESETSYWRKVYERAKTDGAYSVEHSAFAGSSIFHLNINLLERNGELFGLSIFAKDITERKKTEDQIKKSLSEKDTLLRELYHRTKNNMNVIISMLKLQAREIGDERLKKAFGETEDRIISMSLVHEKLYEAQDLSHINLKEYFEDLTRQILANYSLSNKLPSLSLSMEDVYVLLDTAVSCGLIVNELISNTLKYAFPSGLAGEIKIRLRKEGNNEIDLTVSDNGIGLPSGFDAKRDGHLGLRLIESLARGKLRTQVIFNTDHGLSCQLRFTESD